MIMRFPRSIVVLIAFVGGACSKTVNECTADSDCKDVAYPFCDVNGEFGPSGGAKNVCTIVPPDCPIDRCGCSPGATTCSDDQLSTCNADGKSTSSSACTLGCAGTNDRCKTFQPSNGLGPALVATAGTTDVIIPDGSRIDTNSGMVFDSSNFPIAVGSVVTSQANGIDIRAFYALSFDVGSVTVIGSKALAFVAPGPVTISGLVDASANSHTPGPGATISGACIGLVSGSNHIGGGGGNATDGGRGIDNSAPVPGGSPQTAFEPLAGGCEGGGTAGGAGGGAIQIDSLTKITVNAASGSRRGILHVGGGGGADGAGGGGSGGLVFLEAPQVVIGGAITANGGGGGGGLNNAGQDATPDGNPAFGGSNPQLLNYGGSGATIASGVGDANGYSAAGGGALGRLYVKTADGTFATAGAALISAQATSSMLAVQ